MLLIPKLRERERDNENANNPKLSWMDKEYNRQAREGYLRKIREDSVSRTICFHFGSDWWDEMWLGIKKTTIWNKDELNPSSASSSNINPNEMKWHTDMTSNHVNVKIKMDTRRRRRRPICPQRERLSSLDTIMQNSRNVSGIPSTWHKNKIPRILASTWTCE
jgi:hypothetical protein